MKFQKMHHAVISVQSPSAFMFEIATEIETKVGPFWRSDGTDDKVPVPTATTSKAGF